MGQAWRVGLTNGFPLVGLFYGASWGRYTSSYSNVALRPFGGRTLQDLNGSFGMGGNRWGSLSFYGGLRESSSTPGWRSTLGGRYSVPVWGWVSLSAAVARSQGAGPDDWSASLMLNKSFGRRASASLTVQQVGGVQSVQGSLQGSPEGEEGLGYRVSGQQQEQASLTADGEVSWAGAHGTVAVRAQALGGNEVYSARVAGSLTTLFDTVRFGRPVFDSFAVLQVDHLEGVPVYLGGRQVGTTDAQGEVLAPSVNSYGINPFLVKQQDLPFAYTAPRLGAMVLQPWRSGSRVTFDVQRVQAVHGTIAVAVGGAARPADYWVLTVTVNGKGEASPLVEGGEFYLENIPTGSHRVEVAKGDRRCAFTLVVPSSEEPVVELGALTCTTAPAAPAGSAPPPSAPAR
jgi:outer membrane usher protein FimD/PapC